jgi:sugar phosphate isomerase/epimerase
MNAPPAFREPAWNVAKEVGPEGSRVLSKVLKWVKYGADWPQYETFWEAKVARRLWSLARWLHLNVPVRRYRWDGAKSFRFAPSLTTRSEAELLGLSSPRFALRVDLGILGIINLRRLVTFKERARAQQDASARQSDHLERATIRMGTCIADSLICLPKWANKRFNSLQCSLALPYGEALSVPPTPFMQHMPIGGGTCAQAACFMVLSCYADTVNFIPCVAEIAQFCSSSKNTLKIGGMTPAKIVDFFNNYCRRNYDNEGKLKEVTIGLHASSQWVENGENRGLAAVALQSYLESRIPLILPVDMNRMWGARPENENRARRINARLANVARHGRPDRLLDNRVPSHRKVPSLDDKPHRSDHMVTIIGCGHSGEKRFLLNDPASYPFIPASLKALYEARQYLNDADPSHGLLRPFGFISVTPADVKMPLLAEGSGDPGAEMTIRNNKSGLLSLVDDAKRGVRYPDSPAAKLPALDGCNWPGLFRLVNLRADESEIRKLLCGFAPNCPVESLVTTLLKLVNDKKISRGWRWLQWLDGRADSGVSVSPSVWVWNAEKESPFPQLFSGPEWHDFLEFVLVWKQGMWQEYPVTRMAVHSQDGETQDDDLSAPLALMPSIITSFTPQGTTCDPKAFDILQQCAAVRPEEHRNRPLPVELYAFMEPEVEHFKRHVLKRRDLPADAVGFLAALNSDQTNKIGDEVLKQFTSRKLDIVALASFVPEIARVKQDDEGLGVLAVRRLIELAHYLRENGQNTRVVELVAGSRVRGLPTPMEDMHSVSIYHPVEARNQLIENLRNVVSKFADLQVLLSLELEPGPFFVLGDSEGLLDLANRINEHENWLHDWEKDRDLGKKRSSRIGFNLDVSHWNIAGIDPEWIRSEMAKPIRSRITHAHVGGHHRAAHFGDAPLVDDNGMWINPLGDLRPWVEILEQLGSEADRPVPFSGHISLEIEAARDVEQVVKSFRALHEIKAPR